MATELGLLALTPAQKLAQQQPNPGMTPGSWTWNGRRGTVDDNEWEVRAFAEDTGGIMGTTWPPRFYSCTFCRREFRSAQALGGHMNVHRRDRARLRQSPPAPVDHNSSSSSTSGSAILSSSLVFPVQDFNAAATSGGLCLLYPFPGSGSTAGVFASATANGCLDSPSTILSISPYPATRLPSSSVQFSTKNGVDALLCHVGRTENAVLVDNNSNLAIEELDLELRLGQKPSP